MKKVLLSFLFLLLLLSIGAPARGTDLNGMADTPWPMFQHDPQHTGRSPFLGPQHEPHCIWSYDFENIINNGVSSQVIASDGNLILGVGNLLLKV